MLLIISVTSVATVREIELNGKIENTKRKQEEFSWEILRNMLICSVNMNIHIKSQLPGIPSQEFDSNEG